jgi:hypothetical protein
MTDADAPRCGGMKRKGGRCTLPAGWGTSHPGAGTCKLHGGATPQAEVNGLALLARRDALMGPLSIEPQDAILECIRISAGEVAYASERISELSAEQLVSEPRRTLARKTDDGTVQEVRLDPPELHVWIRVRQHAMDRLVNYSFAALKAGVDERRVKIAEQQGVLLAQAVQGILRELGVESLPGAARIARKHLTLVSGGAAGA